MIGYQIDDFLLFFTLCVLSHSAWTLSLPRSASLLHSLIFSWSFSLHCVFHSGAPLPFDWEVNEKELEKPTEDSSPKKKHW